jgi:Na+-transporting NADH:ubiquinone oxidoreductase subunit C
MKSKLSMIVFVLILGSTLTTALVSVDNFTKEPIARHKAIKLQKSVLSSLGFTYDKDSIDESFSENITALKIAEVTFYQDITSGNVAFKIQGMGVQGPIEGMVALTPDLQKIHGISIVHQEETPGLGGRIAEAEFLNRFKGKIITKGLLILPPGQANANNEVHGITGATFSCNAFEDILNNEIKRYVAMIEESK